MFKKFFICLLLFVGLFPIFVCASSNSAAKIGEMYYDSLEDAIANASSNDTIMLTTNTELDDTLLITKTVNINLNGHSISAPEMVFQVQGGTLNITGQGTIKETQPNYGAIMVKGSADSSASGYSIVNVGKDITLEGWSGIFISHDSSKSYGVIVNFAGKINAVNDINGGNGIGVYVNGNIQDATNAPVVNILDGAEITSTGNGLYIAGYSTFNLGKAYISGSESGVAIKSGTLNINGTTIECFGEDSTPTEGYTNGINPSGTALQMESNSGYAGNMKININSGNLKSQNSNVIYEYIGKGNSSQVDQFKIASGTFVSTADKDVFVFSDSFQEKHLTFITGGKYSSNPSSYLETGYTTTLENNLYTVTKSTMKEITSDNSTASSRDDSLLENPLIILVTLGILIILGYFHRKKIFKLLKK